MSKISLIILMVSISLLAACNNANIGIIGGADGPTSIFIGESNEEIEITEELKKYYIDFAMDNRIDFIPDFDENSYKNDELVSSEDFLMLTYYMNSDNLPEDLSMSTKLVEGVMSDYFGIENIEHKSQFKGWTYVEEENKYFPYPEGTAEEGIFDLKDIKVYSDDNKMIYDVTLREYRFPFVFLESDKPSLDMYNSCIEYIKNNKNVYLDNVKFLINEKGKELKNEQINVYNAFYDLILDDNTDGFTTGRTIRIKYYIDEDTEKPRFIYKNEELSEIW